jgi:phosphinothricin acetyltransferase
MHDIAIRLATTDDLAAINDIYNYYVAESTCTYQLEPETIGARREWFAKHGPGYPVTVAENDGEVVAWGALSKFRDRAAYDGTVEGSVYVRRDLLGRSVGRAVLVDLIRRAKELGYHTFVGGASADQEASLRLQASLGFQEVARFREVGKKFGRLLDVVFMQLMLNETHTSPSKNGLGLDGS